MKNIYQRAKELYREICELKREFALELCFDAELQGELKDKMRELETLAKMVGAA